MSFVQVLNDVYQYHLPPVRRIPPLLWTRIRNEMPAYLSDREADGAIVMNWYSNQIGILRLLEWNPGGLMPEQ